MGRIKKHPPVKLIIGFIFSDDEVLRKAQSILVRYFGKADFQSPKLPFKHTAYYEKEIGPGLKRKFIGFLRLIPPERLPKIKIITNKIEARLSSQSKRRINIDPGYIDLSKLMLATTKDYKHRVYLDKGIYAEITLFYQDKSFKPWEWTYPDYKTGEYAAIFNQLRDIYRGQIK
jgi:hypothetical protein